MKTHTTDGANPAEPSLGGWSDTYRKYYMHKKGAERRGIDFGLTYEEWLEIWGPRLADRGRGSSQFGMLRTRDEGGYTVGNVRLGTPKENHQERAVVLKVAKAQSSWASSKQKNLSEPVSTSWVMSRSRVFDEYVENDEESY